MCVRGWGVEWGWALVTYMKSFYKIRSEIRGKINYLNRPSPNLGGGRGRGGGGRSIHKCRSYGPTSSICDHFIIWPSSVTLTFNLPKQLFQMALLLLKGNICAKSFWNSCINVEVMAWTSSIYDYFITLTINLPKHVSNVTTTPHREHLWKIWNPCYSPDKLIYLIFKFNLNLQPTLQKCFKWHFSRTTTVK